MIGRLYWSLPVRVAPTFCCSRDLPRRVTTHTSTQSRPVCSISWVTDAPAARRRCAADTFSDLRYASMFSLRASFQVPAKLLGSDGAPATAGAGALRRNARRASDGMLAPTASVMAVLAALFRPRPSSPSSP